jgi:hypothetical protein
MFKMEGVDTATRKKNNCFTFSFGYGNLFHYSMFIIVWSVEDEELIPSKLVLCTVNKN